MVNILDSIILGVVEGLTEFLPISSTGHLILTSQLLGLPETEFLKSFEVIIQLGAILAVLFLFIRKVWRDWELIKKTAVAFLPAAVVGFGLYSLIKNYFLGNSLLVLIMLFLGGLVFLYLERKPREKGLEDLKNLTYAQAFLIGLFQALAVVPGVSRAGATILGGLSLGLSRPAIVEFSFLLAVPTMFAATGYDLLKSGATFGVGDWQFLAIGFVVAFLTAILAVRWFLRFVSHHSFQAFGWYRIIISLVGFWVLFG
jgi:undecaprenyl-diphosphatase